MPTPECQKEETCTHCLVAEVAEHFEYAAALEVAVTAARTFSALAAIACTAATIGYATSGFTWGVVLNLTGALATYSLHTYLGTVLISKTQ